METTVVLSRKMGEFEVTQRTSDGYFNANALLTQWNSVKENPTKKMAHFIENANTNEFIDTIQSRNSDHADFQSLIISKGRMTINGRTQDKVWMHPFLFIDFSMWLSPEFKYDVIKFVYDELIKQRNDAGDAYKELASAIVKITPKKEIPTAMTKIAQALNFVCTNRHEREMRNQMDEPTMKEMVKLEQEVALLINVGHLTTVDSTINYLRSKWNIKYRPQLFA
jgi:hypothetical protein